MAPGAWLAVCTAARRFKGKSTARLLLFSGAEQLWGLQSVITKGRDKKFMVASSRTAWQEGRDSLFGTNSPCAICVTLTDSLANCQWAWRKWAQHAPEHSKAPVHGLGQ